MKKKYLKPRCETVVVKTTNIICISGDLDLGSSPWDENADEDYWG